jgi:alanyl-tRNA synthetase
LFLSGETIRQRYIDFFKSKGHRHLPSSSLVPHNDPTVLLTTAGMLQFKPIMFGLEQPSDRRVTTYQKCFRTTDLDNVGRTARHHTFFEMLGNFSFGDYYKSEVIPWAWECLTKEFGIPAEKLAVTVYQSDDEAFDIWKDVVGIPAERIVRLGDDTNFWAAGDTGPCGPCSEIYYDLGESVDTGEGGPGSENPRYLEVWNLVFMEFNRLENGDLVPLPAKNIDTGMGLERITSVLQGVTSNYDTDLIRPLIDAAGALVGITYDQADDRAKMALRIIADHGRASVHLIHDGVTPSNEGRGYVLRRVMRRALRYGRLIGMQGAFLYKLVPAIIAKAAGFPELKQAQDRITETIKVEEERFHTTLERGSKRLDDVIAVLKVLGGQGGSESFDRSRKELHEQLKGKAITNFQVIPGDLAFELYDTYGFPMELSEEIALEQGLSVDHQGYRDAMAAQVERARAAHQAGALTGKDLPPEVLEKIPGSIFTGYEGHATQAQVLYVAPLEDNVWQVILDKTPFYSESGGQVSDSGYLISGEHRMPVTDVRKVGDIILHEVRWPVPPTVGMTVDAQVDAPERLSTARHHTGAHLLHAALKSVLGEQVQQAGSEVSPKACRFDFNHNKAVSADEIKAIEDLVNEQILLDRPVEKKVMALDEAKKAGAVALFGEKYGDQVRVINIDGFSQELCGGTHLDRTGQMGLFKIVSEEAIAAGVRRITAVAGFEALAYLRQRDAIVADFANTLKAPAPELPARLQKLQAQLQEKEKEIAALRQAQAVAQAKSLAAEVQTIAGVAVLAKAVDAPDADALQAMTEQLRKDLDGVVILAANVDGKATFIAGVADRLTKAGLSAGNMVKDFATIAGARGGGKPQLARAGGGAEPQRIGEALDRAVALVKDALSAQKV